MRKVKVAAIQPEMSYISHEKVNMEIIKKELETTLALLEKAGQKGCDIVTTCEDAGLLSEHTIYDDDLFVRYTEESAPYIENIFSLTAKKYSMYIVGCYMKKQGDSIYNTASIFDRSGKISGAYQKTHLPASESWQVSPGNDLPVFQLDFGKIGISICYDMMFPETISTLALKGAEIIFHPTFGYNWYDSMGEATLRARANDNGVYIVTSKNYINNGAGKSSIIDHWGHVLADAGFERNTIVTKEINLDNKKIQPLWYFNVPISGEQEVTTRLRKERRPELYTAICEKNERLRVPGSEEKNRIREGIKSGEIHW